MRNEEKPEKVLLSASTLTHYPVGIDTTLMVNFKHPILSDVLAIKCPALSAQETCTSILVKQSH